MVPSNDGDRKMKLQHKGCPLEDTSGWVPWFGGKCPVPVGTIVDIADPDGDVSYHLMVAEAGSDAAFAFWEYKCNPIVRIAAYRVRRLAK